MKTATEKQILYLQCAYRIAEIANSAFEIEPFLQTIATEITRMLAWDRVILGLNQGDGVENQFFIATALPSSSKFTNSYISQSELSLFQFTLRHQDSFLLSTPESPASSETEDPTTTILKKSRFQTIAGFPIPNKEGMIRGAIIVGSLTSRNVPPDEYELLERICQLVTSALIRITLYENSLQSNRIHSAHLSRIIHDLRTPTMSITGYADALLAKKYGPISEKVREAIETVSQSGKRLHKLINDLLAFSKMQAGYITVDHITAVDLIPIIQNVSRMIQPLIEGKHLSLCHDIEPDLPLIQGNSDQLERVLTNLLSNAIKFSETGPITIRALRWGNNQVRMSVQDHGIGISPEHQALIFEEYQQIKHQQTLHIESTGLGLAICRMLVDQMGGKMSLESQLRQGATFSCDFLIAEPSAIPEITGKEETA